MLVAPCFAGKLQIELVGDALLKSRLEAGLVKMKLRQSAIRDLFEQAGCLPEEKPLNKHDGNVVCTLAGELPSTIVVGGHFDFVDAGAGIVDDWSGTSLLPSLYQSLSVLPRKHTYVFVAFAEEEIGLRGSTDYVKHLTKAQRADTKAFVNLECLGLTPTKVWTSRSTPALVSDLAVVAKALALPLQGMNVEKVGDDDSHPFLDAKIPVISLHSITQETLSVIHSDRDKLKAIHFDDYQNSYRLAAYYLAYLDTKLD